jgi:hypothetical protein
VMSCAAVIETTVRSPPVKRLRGARSEIQYRKKEGGTLMDAPFS